MQKDGFNAYIVFIIQMNNVKYFTPNDKTHKEFGDVLRYAKSQGVAILAYKSDVTPDSIELNGKRCKVIL